ncbi:N-acetyltransferase family protein [Propionibacteriaceae bacterium G1746]|uniref:GNAT family N-acetyltransferase n=1 Tax=Aestuariimicrobium sp. G57 TaxID=3418485 RepID=UPI003C16815F
MTPDLRDDAAKPVAVIVRSATPEDAERIAALHTQGWLNYRGLLPDRFLDDPERPGRALARWRSQLAATTDGTGTREPVMQVAVAEAAGRVVGFASWGPCFDPGLRDHDEMVDLWVDADERGRGIGSALLRHGLASCRRPVAFWVLRGNDRAAALYRRFGAVDGRLDRRQPLATGAGGEDLVGDMVDHLWVIR